MKFVNIYIMAMLIVLMKQYMPEQVMTFLILGGMAVFIDMLCDMIDHRR